MKTTTRTTGVIISAAVAWSACASQRGSTRADRTQPTIHVVAEGCSTSDERSDYQKGLGDQPLQADQICGELHRALEAELASRGFQIVADRDSPHDLVAKVSAKQSVRIAEADTKSHVATEISIEHEGEMVDTFAVEGDLTPEGGVGGLARAASKSLVDAALASPKLRAAGFSPTGP